MHEIPKEIVAQRDGFVARLETADDKITTKEAEVNKKLDELNEAIQEYNRVLKEVDDMASEVVGDIESYVADKSEGWKEEKGDAYEDWVSKWSCIDLSVLDLIDEINVEERNHPTKLADLPLVPEG